MSSSKSKRDESITSFKGGGGEVFRKWLRQLLMATAGETDKSGSSIADLLRGLDMGGAVAGAPPMPGGGAAADQRDMQRLRDARLKIGFAWITNNIDCETIKSFLQDQYLGDAVGAMAYLDQTYNTPLTTAEIHDLDDVWRKLDIVHDTGINPESIMQFMQLLLRHNAERPVAHRYSQTGVVEKFLRVLMETSSLFMGEAATELNAPLGGRRFEHPPGLMLPNGAAHPQAGQRDLNQVQQHFAMLWRQACRNRNPGFENRNPVARAATRAFSIKENGLHATLHAGAGGGAKVGAEGGKLDLSDTLQFMAMAGAEIRRGDRTATDFSQFTEDEIAQLVLDGELLDENGEVQASLERVCDANDRRSHEITCDNCFGLGHIKRQCPSPVKTRTISFCIEVLQSVKA